MRTPQQQEAIDGVDDLVTEIERLTAERDYLDAMCAKYEQVCHEFVTYQYPDAMCRERIKAVLSECDEKDGE